MLSLNMGPRIGIYVLCYGICIQKQPGPMFFSLQKLPLMEAFGVLNGLTDIRQQQTMAGRIDRFRVSEGYTVPLSTSQIPIVR